MTWRTIEAEGARWEVRAVAADPTGETMHDDMLEFRAVGGNLPPRRVAVPSGTLEGMDEHALSAAFAKARPLGGDFYGRPGKTMTDAR